MTFKQLIGRYGWLNIEATLLNVYPEKQANLAEYENVYQTLLLLSEKETDLQICIEHVTGFGEQKANVSGRTKTRHITDAQFFLPYCLQFTSWSEWLAMSIANKSFQLFSETEIIVHCLCEMTSKGFDETTIQATSASLDIAIDEMAIGESNNQLPFLSWEELIRQLNEKEK